MRTRRGSYVAGWVAVGLLAVAGFAAFNTTDATPEQVQAQAAAASLGHTAGAYAGLNFALVGNNGDSTVLVAAAVSLESFLSTAPTTCPNRASCAVCSS